VVDGLFTHPMTEDEIKRLKRKYASFSDQELIQIAYIEPDSYEVEAENIALEELNRRGVSDPRNRVEETDQESEAEFFGAEKKPQDLGEVDPPPTKPKRYLLGNLAILVGVLALIPGCGVPIGIVSIGWGALLLRQKRGRLMILTGLIGISLTIVLMGLGSAISRK